MSFNTIPDIPYLARRRTPSDAVGPLTYYPLALTREQLCRLLWQPITLHAAVNDATSGASAAIDSVSPWIYSAVSTAPTYERTRDFYTEPAQGDAPLVAGTAPQHGLTQHSMTISPRSLFRHTARAASFAGTSVATDESSVTTGFFHGALRVEFLNLRYAHTGGIFTTVYNNDDPDFVVESPDDYEGGYIFGPDSPDSLLFDGETMETATLFYPYCILTLVSFVNEAGSGPTFDPAIPCGTIDFLGHPISMYSQMARTVSGAITLAS